MGFNSGFKGLNLHHYRHMFFFGVGTVNIERYSLQGNYQPPSTRLFITFCETKGWSQEREPVDGTLSTQTLCYFPIKLLVIHFISCDTLCCHVFCATQRLRPQFALPQRSCICHCNFMYFSCLNITS